MKRIHLLLGMVSKHYFSTEKRIHLLFVRSEENISTEVRIHLLLTGSVTSWWLR
jgi:hypothetical protein